jgi:hypothetical protein
LRGKKGNHAVAVCAHFAGNVLLEFWKVFAGCL